MKRAMILFVAAWACVGAACHADEKADDLARAVMSASGIDQWPKVKVVRFTFNVEADGKPVISAKHEWDVRAGTDAVAWAGKNVTVNVSAPAEDEDSKAAHQRWVNDSYWLLMPLKLMDAGVTRTYQGTQQVDGQTYEVLQLSFEGVGLTPGDRYNLYIDPDAHLVRQWDYMPSPEKKMTATWDNYQTFGGLTLATEHQMGNRRIYFTDVSVESE